MNSTALGATNKTRKRHYVYKVMPMRNSTMKN